MTKITTTVAMLAIIGLAAFAAPAAAQNRAELQAAAELRIVQQQQAELALAVSQLSQALADAMKAMNARLDRTDENVKTTSANQLTGIRQMADDLRVVREGTQATGTQLGRLREEIEALRTSLPSLLTRLQPPPAPVDPLDPNAPPPQQPPLPPDAGVSPPVSTVGISPERLFNTARADYGAGQFSLAISGYEQFIRTFPDSDLADDAQLGIGDAENALMRFEEAIAAYNRVIQNYPTGDQIPWAYYKRALVERRLQRPDMARASLEMAIKTAPNEGHPVWSLAKQVLDGLTRTPSAPAAPQRP
jgi:TolA-binding protein